jgi:hypothetical protein
MNALPSDQVIVAPAQAASPGYAARVRASARARAQLGAWPSLGILTAFWVYVALSNVLYANSMQVSFASLTPGDFFAPWDARLLQHAMLYPALMAAVAGSRRIGWQPAWRTVPIQAFLGLAFSILGAPLMALSEHLLHPQSMDHKGMSLVSWDRGELAMWLASATSFFLTYLFGLALINGFELYQRFRNAQTRQAALERALTSAHLAALRMQLSPHTLFNLLHTIRGQISWDPSAAQSMVVQLGDLLRRLLAAGELEYSRLTDEVQFVRLYLELQQKRFADRLTIWIADVEDFPTLWVPSLILQPLVENAVVHGLANHTGPVEILVEASTAGDVLSLRIVNTTAGAPTCGRESIGLRNVRERLALQFGTTATFTAQPLDYNSWVAEIRMPMLREAPDSRRSTS